MPGKTVHVTIAAAITLMGLTGATESHASLVVNPGWDLLYTDSSSTVGYAPGQAFQGVPLGTYNFGGTIGSQNVGGADTILRQLSSASVITTPGSASIPIELVAMQLQSTVQINVNDRGLDFYYITLQSARGGPASVGQMEINFAAEEGQPHGTFESSIDIFFDVRKGSLTGEIIMSDHFPMASVDVTSWQHAPTGPIAIDGINHNLNGVDTDTDFWPSTSLFLFEQNFSALHNWNASPVPEASTNIAIALLVSVALVSFWKDCFRVQLKRRLAKQR